MAFKIADGYVEVHAETDRASARRSANEVVEEAERVGKRNEGSIWKHLFKVNPSLMRLLEAPIGSIFGSPIMFAAAATLAGILGGVISTAIATAILAGVGTGLVAAGIFALRKNEQLKKEWNSTLKEINNSMARAAQPLLKPLLAGINQFEKRFLALEPTFKRLFMLAGPLIKPAIDGVMGLIEGMLPGIERAMPGIQVVFDAFAKHMPGLGTAIGDFFATLAENGPLLERVVGLLFTWLDIFFKVLGPVLVEGMRSFATAADMWSALTNAISVGGEKVSEVWGKIPGWWNASWGAVSGFFQGLWTNISNFFVSLWQGTVNVWNSVTGAIVTAWNAVVDWFAGLPTMIWNNIMALPGIVANTFQMMFNTVFYIIGFSAGLVVKAFTDLPVAIWNVTQAGFALVLSLFVMAGEAIVGAVRWGLDFTRNLFSQFFVMVFNIGKAGWNLILGAGKQFIDNVVWFFTQMPPKLYKIVKDTWYNFLQFFSTGAANTVRFAQNLPTNLYNAIKSLTSKFKGAGGDAMRGLINGITGLLGWAVDKARQAAGKIAQGFKDALKIGSPSRLMDEEVGRPIIQGVAQGAEREMGTLDDIFNQIPNHFPREDPRGMSAPVPMSPSQQPGYGPVTVNVNVQNLTELKEIQSFLDGQLMDRSKKNTWAGNLYEAQGEYERNYR